MRRMRDTAMKNVSSAIVAIALACAASADASAKGQGEVTLLAVAHMRAHTQKIIAGFEAKTGRKVKVTYGNGVETRRMVAKGQPLDVSIIIAPFPGALTSGSIVVDSATPIAGVLTAVGVPEGRPKPDISTAGALKKTLPAARRDCYANTDFSGAAQRP